jgi:hypothetical protein
LRNFSTTSALPTHDLRTSTPTFAEVDGRDAEVGAGVNPDGIVADEK